MSERLRVVLATRNAGKAREFDRLLQRSMTVEALDESVGMPEETGRTFEENARLKASSVFDALGGNVAVLADDSGLEVDALAGRPGVLSARFAGPNASDGENVAKLLEELTGASNRKARFVCCLCLILPESASTASGEAVEVRGTLEGEITSEPRGDDGFGYDPVFRPEGWNDTLAEGTPHDKDAVSHRGAASRELLNRLGERSRLLAGG